MFKIDSDRSSSPRWRDKSFSPPVSPPLTGLNPSISTSCAFKAHSPCRSAQDVFPVGFSFSPFLRSPVSMGRPGLWPNHCSFY